MGNLCAYDQIVMKTPKAEEVDIKQIFT